MEALSTVLCVLLLLPAFLLSGTVVTAVMLAAYVLVRPLSLTLFEKMVWHLVPAAAAVLVLLPEYWAGVEHKLYGEAAEWVKLGTENSILLCNHRCDIDWLSGWVVGSRTGVLGGFKAIMKRSAIYVPVLGALWWLSGYIFIARDWMRDKKRMLRMFANLRADPVPYLLVLFAEGTRFTTNKLALAREFAASKGLPLPKHTLVPKTRGFVATAKSLEGSYDSVYDITFMPAQGPRAPSLAGLFARRPAEVHVLLRRIPAADIPKDEDALKEWCMERFRGKDAALAAHAERGEFDAPRYHGTRRAKSVLVMGVFWVCCYLYLVAIRLVPAVLTLLEQGKSRAVARGLALGAVLTALLVRFYVTSSSAKTTDVNVSRSRVDSAEEAYEQANGSGSKQARDGADEAAPSRVKAE